MSNDNALWIYIYGTMPQHNRNFSSAAHHNNKRNENYIELGSNSQRSASHDKSPVVNCLPSGKTASSIQNLFSRN